MATARRSSWSRNDESLIIVQLLLLCIYLSGTVLIGLVLNSLFGWMWADSVAALVIAALAIREGVEAWRGDVESPFEVLEDIDEEHAEKRLS
jgi:divalent metal cation (Fe/Co/Zn/Cd) transporter